MIAIICAMDEEAKGLISDIGNCTVHVVGNFKFYEGTLCGQNVVVSGCGVGKVCAATVTAVAIEKFAPELVINSGVAGGTPPLNQGDMVIPEKSVEHDYYAPDEQTVYYMSDEKVSAALKKACVKLGYPVKTCTIATGDSFIDKPEKVAELKQKFNAEAFDMESAAIAKTCRMFGVKCALVRSISDNGVDDNMKSFYEFLSEAAKRSQLVVEQTLKNL
jgi:MTA/SAH nucleosidase